MERRYEKIQAFPFPRPSGGQIRGEIVVRNETLIQHDSHEECQDKTQVFPFKNVNLIPVEIEELSVQIGDPPSMATDHEEVI